MKFHMIGKKRDSEWGTSLAVLQWMELIRGERAVQEPSNSFRVETITAEEHYCIHCFGVRWMDVVYAVTEKPRELDLDLGQDRHFKILRCRTCAKERGG